MAVSVCKCASACPLCERSNDTMAEKVELAQLIKDGKVKVKMDIGDPIVVDGPPGSASHKEALATLPQIASAGATQQQQIENDVAERLRLACENIRDVTLETCPCKHPSQTYIVWQKLCMPSCEAVRPSAVFDNLDAAKNHALRLSKASPDFDTEVVHLGRWLVLLGSDATADIEDKTEYANKELQRIMETHYQNLRDQHEYNQRRGRGEITDKDENDENEANEGCSQCAQLREELRTLVAAHFAMENSKKVPDV